MDLVGFNRLDFLIAVDFSPRIIVSIFEVIITYPTHPIIRVMYSASEERG